MPSLIALGVFALSAAFAHSQSTPRPFRLFTGVPDTSDGSTQELAGLWITTLRTGAGQEIWSTTFNWTMAPTWFIEDSQIKRVAYGDTKYALTLGGPPYLSDAPAGLDVIASGIPTNGATLLPGWSPLVTSGILENPTHPDFQWAVCKVNTTSPFFGEPQPGNQVFWFNKSTGHAPYPPYECATVQMHGVYDS